MKPALYIVQRTGPRVRLDRLDQDTEEDEEEDDTGELEYSACGLGDLCLVSQYMYGIMWYVKRQKSVAVKSS